MAVFVLAVLSLCLGALQDPVHAHPATSSDSADLGALRSKFQLADASFCPASFVWSSICDNGFLGRQLRSCELVLSKSVGGSITSVFFIGAVLSFISVSGLAARLAAGQQASKPASRQASKPASQQASEPASQQASKPASQQAGRQAGSLSLHRMSSYVCLYAKPVSEERLASETANG